MTLDQLKNQVKAALETAGYTIKEGYADLFTVDGTKDLIPAFDTGFGNNPAAPYVVPAVPHADGEAYDYGKSMRTEFTNDAGEALHWTYRLEEHEALVVFGNLPPEAAFIGYETFMFTRYFDGEAPYHRDMSWLTDPSGLQHHLTKSPDNLLYDNAPVALDDDENYVNDENRVVLFANGPTINRRSLEKTIGPDFWTQQAIFSTSADAGFEATLNAQLGDLAGIHLHSPLGADLKLGLTRKADDFWTLMRYAVPNPDNREESEEWRRTVAENLVVFRVSKPAAVPVVRHPQYTFEEKKGISERGLAADLQKLADAVNVELGFDKEPNASQEVGVALSSLLHAPITIPRAMSAVGATNDADYRVTSARPFGSEEALAVIGVNHTETENASYISLGIYDAEHWLGVKGISQGRGWNGVLSGSAAGFFEAVDVEVPASLAGVDLSKFYVHVLARPGATLPSGLRQSDYCTVILESEPIRPVTPIQPTEPTDSERDEPVVLEPGKRIRISERAYLNPNPDAGCGAHPSNLLSMILLAKGTDISPNAPKRRRRRSSK